MVNSSPLLRDIHRKFHSKLLRARRHPTSRRMADSLEPQDPFVTKFTQVVRGHSTVMLPRSYLLCSSMMCLVKLMAM